MAVEEIKPYDNEGTHKAEQVEKMFDSIAPSYDLMNTLMTFGMDSIWRDKAIKRLQSLLPSEDTEPHILDVACGTGDVTFRLGELLAPCHIEGVDLSEGMLRIARRKLATPRYSHQADRILFRAADCLALPYPENRFDAVTVAYGVRNFEHLDKGYAEMLRVLKPGGVICVIELCEPANPIMRIGYKFYTRLAIPTAGRIFSSDTKAYPYLLQSIAACPQRGSMTRLMKQAGFSDAQCKVLFPSTVAIYTARKPK